MVALTRAFPEYGEQGTAAISGQPAIYLTGESHHSFSKIAHMTGLGRRALRAVPVDETLRMDVAALRARVEEDRADGFVPVMVVGTAGTTGGGAIDPLPALAEFCRDGAALVPRGRGMGWGGCPVAASAVASGRHRTGGLDHLRCAQVVLCPDGRRHVLLPASRHRPGGVPR